MVMEEGAMHGHEAHSPSGGDAGGTSSSTNVYLVGLEFVRQYYTVLNQGPLYLHRFYSDDSSFVHGSSARDSKVAYGQQEIHKSIQSLNFNNCHAKIRQVDSHETLGQGVVIQVTGELSNNGQPMRRFMQTFVLAPQSPKRYYVRNDIFHYQDEVFCDEDGDETPAESAVDTEEADENDVEASAVVGEINGGPPEFTNEISQPQAPANVTPTTLEVSVKSSPPVNRTNMADEEQIIVSAAVPDHEKESVATVSAAESAGIQEEGEPAPAVAPNNSGPKTFANLFKGANSTASINKQPPKFQSGPPKGTNGPLGSATNSQFAVNTENTTTSPPQISPQPGQVAKGLPPRNPRGPGGYRDNRENNRPPQGDRDSKERRERLTSRSSTTLNDDSGSIDGERRRPVHTYPDANQLFVGNLPHYVTIQDMKNIFEQFGEVAEVKIQKPTPKSGGTKVPYFCFVVFEEASSAQAAIEKKSEIFMKTNGNQRRLNVEQKRSQRSGRLGEDDAPYNRMETSSPAGGRPSDGGGRGPRTFRGSNRGGGGDRGDRDNRGGHSGHMGRGRGGLGPGRGNMGNKP